MLEGLRYYLGLANGVKVSNITTGQAKLFDCTSALLIKGRPCSTGKICNSTSNPEERTAGTQLMCIYTVQKMSVESVTK